MTFRSVWIALAVGLVALAPVALGDDDGLVTVTVEGAGMSREEALHNAKRKAVEQGSGTYVYSQTKTENFALVKDTILARSAGFIHSVEVLSWTTDADGIVGVRIKAQVSLKGIKDTWGVVTSLLQDRGRPKIMVFLRERIGTDYQDSSTVATRIENLLLKSGFLLVDRKQIKAIDEKDLQTAIEENNPAKAAAIAKKFGAQLFVTGTANASAGRQQNIYGRAYYTYEAEANVRCYRSDTGQLLSSIPGKPTRGVKEVWRSAAKQALDLQAQQVAPQVQMDILRFWQDALEGRGEVKLQISGVSFRQYVQIKKALNTLQKVKGVSPEYHNQIVDASIQTDLTAIQLAEKIIEVLEDLEIQDVSANVIKGTWKGQ
jgi:hypothetical protein